MTTWEQDSLYIQKRRELIGIISYGNLENFINYIETDPVFSRRKYIFRYGRQDFGDSSENNMTLSKIFRYIRFYHFDFPRGMLDILMYIRMHITELSGNGRMTRTDKREYFELLQRIEPKTDPAIIREKRIVESMWFRNDIYYNLWRNAIQQIRQ